MGFFDIFKRAKEIITPSHSKEIKQWQNLQPDGSWQDCSEPRSEGTYRLVTIKNGIPTFSTTKSVDKD